MHVVLLCNFLKKAVIQNITTMDGNLQQELDEIKKLIADLKLSAKKYLSIDEAAQYLGIRKSTLYKHTSSGLIPYYKPNGKLITFNREDLDHWLLQTRIPSNVELRAIA